MNPFKKGDLVKRKPEDRWHGPKLGYGVVVKIGTPQGTEGVSREGKSLGDAQERGQWIHQCFEMIHRLDP